MQSTAVDDVQTYLNEQAWYGPDLEQCDDWVYRLSAEDVQEIDAALAAFEALGAPIMAVNSQNFRLPRLQARLQELEQHLFHGRGFQVLRGLPVEKYSKQQASIIFLGLGSYLGLPVSQNGKGHVLGHVKNLGLDFNDPETRGYQNNSQLAFHTDFSDVVGLLCLQTPQSGGESSLASSTTVWNEMVRRSPELARVLTEAVHYTRWGELLPGEQRYNSVPVFTPLNGRVICFFNARRTIMKAQAFAEVPRVTEQQLQALDLIESIVHDRRIHMNMVLERGDMQFVCNHFILHTRTSYEDWPELERRRHLLRLWLACENGPQLPDYMNEFQGRTANGRPAGIQVPGVALCTPLEAE